jgi:hypothetical protein
MTKVNPDTYVNYSQGTGNWFDNNLTSPQDVEAALGAAVQDLEGGGDPTKFLNLMAWLKKHPEYLNNQHIQDILNNPKLLEKAGVIANWIENKERIDGDDSASSLKAFLLKVMHDMDGTNNPFLKKIADHLGMESNGVSGFLRKFDRDNKDADADMLQSILDGIIGNAFYTNGDPTNPSDADDIVSATTRAQSQEIGDMHLPPDEEAYLIFFLLGNGNLEGSQYGLTHLGNNSKKLSDLEAQAAELSREYRDHAADDPSTVSGATADGGKWEDDGSKGDAAKFLKGLRKLLFIIGHESKTFGTLGDEMKGGSNPISDILNMTGTDPDYPTLQSCLDGLATDPDGAGAAASKILDSCYSYTTTGDGTAGQLELSANGQKMTADLDQLKTILSAQSQVVGVKVGQTTSEMTQDLAVIKAPITQEATFVSTIIKNM